jgi:hypothetical protein
MTAEAIMFAVARGWAGHSTRSTDARRGGDTTMADLERVLQQLHDSERSEHMNGSLPRFLRTRTFTFTQSSLIRFSFDIAFSTLATETLASIRKSINWW